jgi:hypothetical protein
VYHLQKYLRTKYKIAVSEQLNGEIDTMIYNAVNLAEERAHQALKTGKSLDGTVKKAIAIEFVRNQKVGKNLTAEQIEALILATLGQSRNRSNRVIL